MLQNNKNYMLTIKTGRAGFQIVQMTFYVRYIARITKYIKITIIKIKF